jgi:hypothetical protein
MREPFTADGLYPPDHQFGMEVPSGGSNCAKCEYLADNKKDCTEEHFIEWQRRNGAEKPEEIPRRITAYCCDDFEAAKSRPLSRREAWDGMSDKDILESDRPVEKEEED